MFTKLEEVEKRYNHLNDQMSDPKVIARQQEFQQYAREHSELAPVVAEYRVYKKIQNELENNQKILEEDIDEEILTMAREEIIDLRKQMVVVEQKIKIMILPRDPRDERSVIMEIRAGTSAREIAFAVKAGPFTTGSIGIPTDL